MLHQIRRIPIETAFTLTLNITPYNFHLLHLQTKFQSKGREGNYGSTIEGRRHRSFRARF